MKVRIFTRLLTMRYLGFYNVLHGVSGPSPLIESPDSKIIVYIITVESSPRSNAIESSCG